MAHVKLHIPDESFIILFEKMGYKRRNCFDGLGRIFRCNQWGRRNECYPTARSRDKKCNESGVNNFTGEAIKIGASGVPFSTGDRRNYGGGLPQSLLPVHSSRD